MYLCYAFGYGFLRNAESTFFSNKSFCECSVELMVHKDLCHNYLLIFFLFLPKAESYFFSTLQSVIYIFFFRFFPSFSNRTIKQISKSRRFQKRKSGYMIHQVRRILRKYFLYPFFPIIMIILFIFFSFLLHSMCR